MKFIKLSILGLAVAALAGCASDDYKMYADSQAKIDTAKYTADAERWKAMGVIAANGTESAKIAAVIAMAMSSTSGTGSGGGSQMQRPQASEALQWASLIVPSVTQLAGISANMRLGIAQSDNAFKASVSMNETFLGMAGKIQAPAANVTTTTTTNTTSSADVTTTFSGTGVLGSGTYTTAANPTTTTTTNANPTTTTTTSTANPTTSTTTTNANPTTTTTTTPTTTITCTGNTVTTGNNGCPPGP